MKLADHARTPDQRRQLAGHESSLHNLDAAVSMLFEKGTFDDACEPYEDGCACDMVADCSGEIWQMLCPGTCGIESYPCTDHPELAYAYLDMLSLVEPLNVNGATTCEEMRAAAGSQQFPILVDKHNYGFCEHPALGLLCPTVCQSDCTRWPPPQAAHVFLPNCADFDPYLLFPKDKHRFEVQEKIVGTADSTYTCPPVTDYMA
eukprot:CAMPEP_0197849910 /NCGR_PEP_ID=MMETSP1438-20131217/13629_1 /TAXON_ID=1461541 /ORGANISM="Pterosperma sp., Strain CCMP1384" /LENGTH=203 /DNA_ID=CAMNT_0043462809 /DNA_START=204 /DNA_END=815 /DNA_ORIENTATION=-